MIFSVNVKVNRFILGYYIDVSVSYVDCDIHSWVMYQTCYPIGIVCVCVCVSVQRKLNWDLLVVIFCKHHRTFLQVRISLYVFAIIYYYSRNQQFLESPIILYQVSLSLGLFTNFIYHTWFISLSLELCYTNRVVSFI